MMVKRRRKTTNDHPVQATPAELNAPSHASETTEHSPPRLNTPPPSREPDNSQWEQTYRYLFNTMAQGAVYQDRRGKIILVNPAAERLLGLSQEQLKNRDSHDPCWQAIRENGAPFPGDQHPAMVALRTGKTVENVIMGIYHPQEKQHRWIQVSAIPQFNPPDTQPHQVYTTFTDITDRKRAEEKLKETVQYISDIIHAIPAGLCIYEHQENDKLILVDANPEAERLTGLSLEQCRGKEFNDIWPQAETLGITHSFLSPLKTGQIYEVEHLSYQDDRLQGIFRVRAFPMPRHRLGVAFENITGQKKAEQALRDREARLQSIFRAAPIGIGVVSNRVLMQVNNRICEMTGYTPEELIGQNARIIYPSEQDYQFVDREKYRQIRQKGTGTVETRWKHKDGTIIDVLLNSTPLDLDDFSVGVTFTALDITERKQTEEKLKTSETRYRELFNNMPNGVAVYEAVDDGADFVFKDLNPAGAKMDRFPREQTMGRRVTEIFPGVTELGLLDVFRNVWQTGRPRHLPATLYQDQKLESWRENNVYKLPSGEIVAVYSDETERKIAEQERERLIADLETKNAELERFNYTVSHDLKSPLITIKGFLGMLEKDLCENHPDRIREDMMYIANATDKMQQLLNELLELSRIGRLVNPYQSMSLTNVAREACKLVAGVIHEKKTHIDIPDNLPVVTGDYPRLQEIFQNLIENAVKFMGDQPHPRIEIGVRPEENRQVIFVRDNGIGIDPRYHDKIFELFDKLSSQSEGTGIGLALVKRIVETHGGTIWVESEGPGRGSCFCFTLATHREIETHENE